MATRRQDNVRVLLWLARDLEARHYPRVGILRQVARDVATMTFDEPEEGRCGCGRVIAQPRTGRPRKHCLDCRPRRITREKSTLRGEAAEADPNEGAGAA